MLKHPAAGYVFVTFLLLFLGFVPSFRSRSHRLSIEVATKPDLTILSKIRLTPISTFSSEYKSGKSISELLTRTRRGLLINFWATWCPPCIEELPTLEMLHRQFKESPNGIQLVTISVDENPRDVVGLLGTLDFTPTFEVFHDAQARMASAFGVTKFPETFLLSIDGSILRRWAGPQDWMSFDIINQLKSTQD